MFSIVFILWPSSMVNRVVVDLLISQCRTNKQELLFNYWLVILRMHQHRVTITSSDDWERGKTVQSSRCVLQFDHCYNRLFCVAHINKRQGSSETTRRDSKQVLELRDAHVTGWSGSVASDQRLRKVGDYKTKSHHTQNDLERAGEGGAVMIKPCITG